MCIRDSARVAENVNVKAMGALQAAAQKQGLVPVQPQPMQKDDQARFTAPAGVLGYAAPLTLSLIHI